MGRRFWPLYLQKCADNLCNYALLWIRGSWGIMCWLQNSCEIVSYEHCESHIIVRWTDFLLLLQNSFSYNIKVSPICWKKPPHLSVPCNVAKSFVPKLWYSLLRSLFLQGRGPEILVYFKYSKTLAYCTCTEKFSLLWLWYNVSIIRSTLSTDTEEPTLGKRSGDFFSVYFRCKVLLELFFKVTMPSHAYMKSMSWCQGLAVI